MPRVAWRVWAAQKNSLQLSTVFPPSPVIHSSCFCFLIPRSQFRDKWPLTQMKATISSCLMAFSYSLVLFPSGKKSVGSLVNTALLALYCSWALWILPTYPGATSGIPGFVLQHLMEKGSDVDGRAAAILQSVWECRFTGKARNRLPETGAGHLSFTVGPAFLIVGTATCWGLHCKCTAWESTLPWWAAPWAPGNDWLSDAALRHVFAEKQLFFIHTYIWGGHLGIFWGKESLLSFYFIFKIGKNYNLLYQTS